MSSPTMSDEQLSEKYGRRPHPLLMVPVFEPQEFGYRCPKGHGGDYLTWSEFNDHIWCYKCQMDYHYAHECTIQRPSWMTVKQFEEFLSTLPEKPKILDGVDRWVERLK